MKHRTHAAGRIFRIALAAALGVGVIALTGQAAYASLPASVGGPAAPGPVSTTVADDVLVPQCHADVSISVSDDPDPVEAGGTLTYVITVTNHGPEDTNTLTLSDTLPEGTTFRSLDAPYKWNCTTPEVGKAGTVTCSKYSLKDQATAQFTLVVDVAPDLRGGTVLENAAAIPWKYDTDKDNNTATVTTRVPWKMFLMIVSRDYP